MDQQWPTSRKRGIKMKLKVVGVLAYDSIISEFGKKENLFGGSATHFAISSSYLNKNVHVTGAIGNDFDLKDIGTLSSMGICLLYTSPSPRD